jgi:hypothetical protein
MIKLFEFRESILKLKALVGNLTVQNIDLEKDAVQGLLLSLCSMTSTVSTPESEAAFIRDLRAHASSERQATGVEKLPSERQRLK